MARPEDPPAYGAEFFTPPQPPGQAEEHPPGYDGDDAPPSAAGGRSGGGALDWSSDGRIKIGLWGAPGSGKTTFLGALFLAVLRHPELKWSATPLDEASEEYQEDLIMELEDERTFPEATGQLTAPLSWRFSGPDLAYRPASGRGWRRGEPEPGPRTVRFDLELQDLPGGVFDFRQPQWNEDRGRIIQHLARTDGFIYLYDPLSDLGPRGSTPRSFRSFGRMVKALKRAGTLDAHQKLPQQIAVCLSKMDSPAIFDLAEALNYTPDSTDVRSFGRLNSVNSAALFEEFCERNRAGSADLVRAIVEQDFAAERTRYYATSAIGFYSDGSNSVDRSDALNYEAARDADGNLRDRIRGPVQPVNVLEPLVDLAKAISGDRR